ncbi:MAG: hypothetical protein A2511_16630 [Deltaproteobacteria bacterium RIFOXYD12_FULL_50_9]|nr:MAG: hypothetical protein A2511_16630 [Deltaproteobacteria bacterium RIFOXYD12_FULL_50_9]
MQIIKSAYLECIVPSQNRRAFYLIQAELDMYGFLLVRQWGRIGTRGQRPLKIRFQDKQNLLEEFGRVLKIRISHKYVLQKESGEGRGREKIELRIFNKRSHQPFLEKKLFLAGLNRLGCKDPRQLCLFKSQGD